MQEKLNLNDIYVMYSMKSLSLSKLRAELRKLHDIIFFLNTFGIFHFLLKEKHYYILILHTKYYYN